MTADPAPALGPYPAPRQDPQAGTAGRVVTINQPATYAVLGCGYAAALNHYQLTHGANRAVMQRVLLSRLVRLGLAEPWLDRGPLRMGQFAHLIRSATFPHALSSGDGYVCSDDLGRYIRAGFAAGQQNADDAPAMPASSWVGLIEVRETYDKQKLPKDEAERRTKAEPDDPTSAPDGNGHVPWRFPTHPYRMSVFWRDQPGARLRLRYVYVHYIDLCTGPGPARRFGEEEVKFTPLKLRDEHVGDLTVPIDKTTFHRLVHGEDLIGGVVADHPGARVLVYGGGPTAAWCVDYVRQKGAVCDWVARDSFDRSVGAINPPYAERRRAIFAVADVPGGRNTAIVAATRSTQALGEIKKIEALADGRLAVTFSVAADAVESWGGTGCEVRIYDQVVTAMGQDSAKRRDGSFPPGSAAYLLQQIDGMRVVTAGELWNGFNEADQQIPVAIVHGLHAIRVLGAAMASGPGLSKDARIAFLDQFHKKLVERLPPEGRAAGFSLFTAQASITLANRHVGTSTNVNWATASQLHRVVDDPNHVDAIIKRRMSHPRGIQSLNDLTDLGLSADAIAKLSQ